MNTQGITLIGMPGSGKSTIGKRLAKILNKEFVDLDILLYEKSGIDNMAYFKKHGEEAFLELEEKLALELSLADTVFSPGGSIVYSEKAMEKITRETFVIYLKIKRDVIKKRLQVIKDREIVGLKQYGFDKLFTIREKLYEQYADAVIDTDRLTKGKTVQAILDVL